MSPTEHDLGIARRYFETVLDGDLDAFGRLLAPDYEEVYPQSGERLRGAAAAVELMRRHPEPPRPAVDLVLTSLGRGVVLGEILTEEMGERYWVVALLDIHDGRVHRERVYFAAPFAVPGWRADYVDMVDPADPLIWVADGSGPDVTRSTVEGYGNALVGDARPAIEAFVHPDWNVVYPQSGERHDFATEMRIDTDYPEGLPRRQVVDIRGASELWVVTPTNVPMLVATGGRAWVLEGIFEYATGDRWHAVLVGYTRDGRMWRERHYWAQPFEPGTWRTDLVEQIAIGGGSAPGSGRGAG
jgi:ketosteroid isomerase-like protein